MVSFVVPLTQEVLEGLPGDNQSTCALGPDCQTHGSQCLWVFPYESMNLNE